MKTKLLLALIVLISFCINVAVAQTHTFTYTGSPQTYTVPAGIHYLAVDAMGASGGVDDLFPTFGSVSGCGGRTKCLLPVAPGDILKIYVGGKGPNSTEHIFVGGYNGGGSQGVTSAFGYVGGGGGATDIRIGGTTIANRVIIAAGGGGSGVGGSYNGGDGGGLMGLPAKQNGIVNSSSGLGGTQSAGGAGATLWGIAESGSLFAGGVGVFSSGGGGGGYYGGGGGSGLGGGGGGSSYVNMGVALAPVYISGQNCRSNGLLIITEYTCLPPFAGNIVGDTQTCIGATATYIDTGGTTGGIWSITDPSVVMVNSTSGIVSGVGVGSTTITYSVTNSCGTAITTTTVKVLGPSCTGLPFAGIAVGSKGCGTNVVNLTLSSATAGCGIIYQWQKSADTAIWVDMPYQNDTIAMDVISSYARVYYRCKVLCVYSGAISYSDTIDLFGNNYHIDSHNEVTSDSDCNKVLFRITSCGEQRLHMRTYFGDGTFGDTLLTVGTIPGRGTTTHNYTSSGAYTIKHILYDSIRAQDSVVFTYNHVSCKSLPIKFYFDNNSNCIFDTGDYFNKSTIAVAVDSNGLRIDTVSCTSGFFYNVREATLGSVYTFTPISYSGGLSVSCPSAGYISDTILSGIYPNPVKYFGLSCSSTSDFDLSINSTACNAMSFAYVVLQINNNSCNLQDATVTYNINPKYRFYYSSPWRTAISGNTVTWLLPNLADSTPTKIIKILLHVPGPLLTIGDTVLSSYTVAPFTGDLDTLNNKMVRIDTIRSAYDPNYKEVRPFGNVLPGDELTYTIHFENTGNDTAHNIYVLDTLSPLLDVETFSVLSASAVMMVDIQKVGVYQIVKFDFPNIMLPDSSHHGFADGMFTFKIQTKPTVADGTVINNRAGIYFDDNPVVMTEYCSKKVGLGPLAGPDTMCVGATATIVQTEGPFNGIWSKRHDWVAVTGGVATGITAGDDTVDYTCTNKYLTRAVAKKVTVMQLPETPVVTGADTLCEGDSALLASSLDGGYWKSTSSNVWVDSIGNVVGTQLGIGSIIYTKEYYCGISTATKTVFVIADSVCHPTPVLRLPHGLYLNPNPNKGSFEVLFTSDKDEVVAITLYSAIGERIMSFKTTTNKTERLEMNIPKGIYLINAASPRNKFVKKMVVE